MREQLESHAGELDHAQRLRNQATDLKARLRKQTEENDLLEQLAARQGDQLSQMGLSAAQKREFEKLRVEHSEVHDSLRSCTQRANELSRQQHAVQLQWSRLCARREKLKRGLASDAVGEAQAGEAQAAGGAGGVSAADKAEARIEHATKALKVANASRLGQERRHQQRLSGVVSELMELRQLAESLAARLGAEGVETEVRAPPEAELQSLAKPLGPVQVPEITSPPRTTQPAGQRPGATKARHKGGAAAEAPSPGAGARAEAAREEANRRQRAAVTVQSGVRGRRARLEVRARATAAAEAAAAAKSAFNPFGMGGKKKGGKGGVLGGGMGGGMGGGVSAKPFGGMGGSAAAKPFGGGGVAPYKSTTDATVTAAPPSSTGMGRFDGPALGATNPHFGKMSSKPSDSKPFSTTRSAEPPPPTDASPATESASAAHHAAPQAEGVDGNASARARPAKATMPDFDDLDLPEDGALAPPISQRGGALAGASKPHVLGAVHAPHPPKPAPGQENAPPRAGAASGMGGMGGIASTIAAARSEADEMPQPTRLLRPGGMAGGGGDGPKPTLLSGRGLAGRGGGMMGGRGVGGRGGGGRGLMPMRAGAAAADEARPGMASHYDDDDGDDGLTAIPSLPSLGDAPRGGGPAQAQPRLIDQLKPPTFDDDIDEDELAAEEAAILARKKAQAAGAGAGGAGGGAPSMMEGAHRAGSSAAMKPADKPAAPAPKKGFGAPLQSTKVAGNSPMGSAGLDIDIDDLFEEEVVL